MKSNQQLSHTVEVKIQKQNQNQKKDKKIQ